MKLVDFVTWIKRESRYGGSPVITGPAAAADQPTLDILTSLNARRKRIWRKPGGWPWVVTQISFPVVPGNTVYSVLPAVAGQGIDRIYNLIPIPQGSNPPVSGEPLKLRTARQFAQDTRDYYQNIAPNAPGTASFLSTPTIYKNLGQNAAGLWTIQLWPSPAAAFTMGGDAKGILNTFLIGDVTGIPPFSPGNTTGAANPPLDYFPDGVIEDILFEGVMSDVERIQGDPAQAASLNGSFEGKVKLLAAEESAAASDNTPITRSMPAAIQRRMSRRCRRW
jgi:hypothetical protein